MLLKNILKAMDMNESPYSAVNLLIDIGYLPLHFNAQGDDGNSHS